MKRWGELRSFTVLLALFFVLITAYVLADGLIFPPDRSTGMFNRTFNFSTTLSFQNCTLYHNFSGTFKANTTGFMGVPSGKKALITNFQPTSGSYKWNVYCYNASNRNGSARWLNSSMNFTFSVAGASNTSNHTGYQQYNLSFKSDWTSLNVLRNVAYEKQINVTNDDNVTRVYGISMASSGELIDLTLKENLSQGSFEFINVTFAAYQSKTLQLVLISRAEGASYVDVIARPASNATVKLNSSVSLGGPLIINGEIPNITVKLMAPLNGWTAEQNEPIMFKFNVTSNWDEGYSFLADCGLWSNISGSYGPVFSWPSHLPISLGVISFANTTLNINETGSYDWNIFCFEPGDTGVNATASTNSRFSVTNISDHIAPTVNMTDPPKGYNSSSSTVTFYCQVTDVSMKNVTLYDDSTGSWAPALFNNTPNSGTYSFTRTFGQGNYKANCYGCDEAGNCAFGLENKSFTVDLTNPTTPEWGLDGGHAVSNNGLWNIWLRSADLFTLYVTSTDNMGLSRATINSTQMNRTSATEFHLTTNLASLGYATNGKKNVSIVVTDYSGRQNRTRIIFIVDDAKPQVAGLLVNASYARKEHYLLFKANASDANLSTVELRYHNLAEIQQTFTIGTGTDLLNLYQHLAGVNAPMNYAMDGDLASVPDSIAGAPQTIRYGQGIAPGTNASVIYTVNPTQSNDPAFYLFYPIGTKVYTYSAFFNPELLSTVGDNKEWRDFENMSLLIFGRYMTFSKGQNQTGNITLIDRSTRINLVDSDYSEDNYGGKLYINGTLVPDVTVDITATFNPHRIMLSEIDVTWYANNYYYVPAGGKLSDQLGGANKSKLFLRNVDFEFAGTNFGTTDKVRLLSGATNKYKVKAQSNAGGSLDFYAFYNPDTNVNCSLGRDDNHEIITTVKTRIRANDSFIVSSNKFSHLVEVDSFDSGNAKVKFKDVGTGNTFEVSTTSGTGTIYLDGFTYNFKTDYNAKNINITDATMGTDGPVLYTVSGAKIMLYKVASTGNCWFNITEKPIDPDGSGAVNATIGIAIARTGLATATPLSINTPTAANEEHFMMHNWSSKNISTGYTTAGTYVLVDMSPDQDYANITIPYSRATADVNIISSFYNTTKVMDKVGNYWIAIERPWYFGCNSTGSCMFNVLATDLVGNANSTTIVQLTVDNDKPKVFAEGTTDVDGIVRSTDRFIVYVNASDSGSGVASVVTSAQMTNVAGNLWMTSSTNATKLGCSPPGPCKIWFTAIDNVGNINNTISTTIIVDDVQPGFKYARKNVSIPIGNGMPFKVSVEATDNIDVKNVSVRYASNEPIQMTKSGNWSAVVTASTLGIFYTGTYDLTIYACDNTSNCNSTTVSGLVVDVSKPRVWGLTANRYYVNSSTRVNFSVYANDTSMATVMLNYSGTMLLMNHPSGVYYTLFNKTSDFGCSNTEGICIFHVLAADSLMNINSSAFVNVRVDDKKPQVKGILVNDSDGYIGANQVVKLNTTVIDDNVTTVRIRNNATTFAGGRSYVIINKLTNIGCSVNSECNLTVLAVDGVNNRNGSVYRTVYLDAIAPTIMITMPLNNSNSSGRLINFTVSDSVAIDNSSISITGASNFNLANCYGTSLVKICSFNATGLLQGTNTIHISVNDRAGNSESATLVFRYDSRGPVISASLVPSTNTTNPAPAVTLRYTITDAINKVSQAWYNLDGSVSKTKLNLNAINASLAGLYAGTHTITVGANDSLGNLNTTSSLTFYISGKVNVTDFTHNLKGGGDVDTVKVYLKNGSEASGLTNFTSNLRQEIKVNATKAGTNVTINISIFGNNIVVTKSEKPKLDVNTTGELADAIRRKVGGTNFIAFVMYTNMSYMIGEDNYKNSSGQKQWVEIHIQKSLGLYAVVYVADDSGNSINVLGNCAANQKPTTTPSVTNACYTNGTNWVKVWVPHLSGAALANPNSAPDFAVTSPGKNITDSLLSFTGFVYDLNLNASSCMYNLTTGLIAITSGTLSPTLVAGTTNYSFGLDYSSLSKFRNLTNQIQYNISVSCASLGNSTRSHKKAGFLVNDKTGPTATVSVDSSTTTALVTITTDYEPVNYTMSYSVAGGGVAHDSSSLFRTLHSTNLLLLGANTAYNYTVKTCDQARNCNTTSGIFTTASNAVIYNPGSAGGGGGGGVIKNTMLITKYWDILRAGKNSVTIATSDYGIKRIDLEVVNSAKRASMAIERYTAKPADIPDSGWSTYKYLQVSFTNVDTGSISQALIQFAVSKDWMSSASATVSSIALLRLVDGNWVELPTTLIDKSATEVNFQAVTPGFSYFAIVNKGTPTEDVAKATLVSAQSDTVISSPTGNTVTNIQTETFAEPGVEPTTFDSTKIPIALISGIITSVCLVIFGLSYYFFKGTGMSKLEKQGCAYVAKCRQAGKSEMQIEQILAGAHWPPEEIIKIMKK